MINKLQSLDLFSGIGGFSYALHDLATPLLYCDNDPTATAALESLMARRLLPRARVHPDVATLSPAQIKRGKSIDLILAGFPCIGFSTVGLRQGFAQQGSGLYSHIVRLVDVFLPPLVFMENVPNTLHMGMPRLCKDFGARGYDLRWCVLTADALGAPQRRKRWFCLAIRRGFEVVDRKVKENHLPSWSPTLTASQRMTLTNTKYHGQRHALLGNSVVPQCVRYAFLLLLGGFAAPPGADDHGAVINSPIAFGLRCDLLRAGASFPKFGFAVRDQSKKTKVYKVHYNNLTVPKDKKKCTVVVDPAAYDGRARVRVVDAKLQTSLPITRAKCMTGWSTPRHGMTRAGHVLSRRSVQDLPTQLRFERSTPDRLRAGQPHARFVEWLMGYPPNWTDFERLS